MADPPLSRSDYPVLNEFTYLNQASLGLIGEPAVQAMHAFLEETARHGNLRMTDEDEVGFFDSLRQRGARILHCDAEHLAILASASELLGQLPFLLRPPPGSRVVAVSTDFPAVTRPWIRYATEHSCSLQFVEESAGEDLTQALIEAINERTAVVAVSSVQFSTGSRVDIPRLRAATAEVQASLVVDVTQAAGVQKIDARGWGAEVVVTSGYKWLGGHGGVALATVAPKLLERTPLLPGWMSAPEPFDFDATEVPFAADARRFTQSTMSYVSMVGLTTALNHLLSTGEGRIEEHSRNLSRRLREGAAAVGWSPFRALDDPSASPHIVALSHSEFEVGEVVEELRRRRIVCGARNGRLRVSLAPYNSYDDVDVLVEALGGV